MSDDHQHESPIKTPKQLITIVVLSFVVPIALIVLLVNYVTGGKHGERAAGVESQVQSTSQRIAPVAAYNLKDPNAPKVYLTGEALFKQACVACHGEPGVPGSPKFGDKAGWAARLGQGLEGLFASAVKGKGAMPPRGGTLADDVSDYELRRAIVYMANSAGASFQEPTAPPAGAPAAPATAAAAPAAAATPAVVIPPPVAAAAAPAAAGGAGKALYDKSCQVCHAAGIAGAPKFGDKAAWAPHIAKGLPELYKSAVNGTPKGMPPKGTAMDASDADLKAAVDYMVGASK